MSTYNNLEYISFKYIYRIINTSIFQHNEFIVTKLFKNERGKGGWNEEE